MLYVKQLFLHEISLLLNISASINNVRDKLERKMSRGQYIPFSEVRIGSLRTQKNWKGELGHLLSGEYVPEQE